MENWSSLEEGTVFLQGLRNFWHVVPSTQVKHGKLFQLATLLRHKRVWVFLWFRAASISCVKELLHCCTQVRLYASGQDESSKTEGTALFLATFVCVPNLYIDMCIYPGTTATVTYSCRKSAMMHPVKNGLKEQYAGSTQCLFRDEARKMALLSERCFLRRKMRGKVLAIFPAKLFYFFLTGNDLILGSIV